MALIVAASNLPDASETSTAAADRRSDRCRRRIGAWWGVLRGQEPVPAALPPMLGSLADGTSLLRDELRAGGQMRLAYPRLVSAAR